jgi:hypothetical protein
MEQKSGSKEIEKSWYCVDPDNNLSETAATMKEVITPFEQKWNWTGFYSTYPELSVMK